ncbi:MAG TPA: DNA-3-methyladenine glycosylase 2 family protein, partial [Dehalococcoidia bacterium]|nr:DNA-3-methyladenine glycosylase 2 family protein [Dehalococcoidia bacterium]
MQSETPFSVEAAHAHLRQADPVLARVIAQIGSFDWRQRDDPYLAVVRTIMFQQLAGAAATAIMRRFFAYYGDAEAPPSPAQMLETSDEQFRSTGVSRQKAGYLRDLALHIVEGRLDFGELAALSDEAVTTKLTAVKGLGE